MSLSLVLLLWHMHWSILSYLILNANLLLEKHFDRKPLFITEYFYTLVLPTVSLSTRSEYFFHLSCWILFLLCYTYIATQQLPLHAALSRERAWTFCALPSWAVCLCWDLEMAEIRNQSDNLGLKTRVHRHWHADTTHTWFSDLLTGLPMGYTSDEEEKKGYFPRFWI